MTSYTPVRLEGGPHNGHIDAVTEAPPFVTLFECRGCGGRHVAVLDGDEPTDRAVYVRDRVEGDDVVVYVYQRPDDAELWVEFQLAAVRELVGGHHPHCRHAWPG